MLINKQLTKNNSPVHKNQQFFNSSIKPFINSQIVKLGTRSYPLYYGTNTLQHVGTILNNHKIGKNLLIVSDINVKHLYGNLLERILKSSGRNIGWCVIPTGEQHKNLHTICTMYDRALARKIDKSSCVVALGGGVIQDLTNYLSATYLRGVPFVQIPTTLLAQADIGMGGCAIDHPKVKSLVGSFYQPKFVFIDTKFLDTLPKSEISNGIAEIINKVVCLAGQNIGDLQKDIALMKSKDHLILKKYIILSNKIKKKIIEQDEIGFKGSRQVLDFGHTVTYALERILNYRISHGTALGIGMHGGALLSFQKGVLKRTELENLKQLISLADLPLHLPKKIDLRELLNLMHCDQKIKNGKIRFVLLKGFGKPFLSKGFDDIEIKKCLRKLVDN